MEFKKSTLKIKPFAEDNVNSIVTRITDLRSVLEFLNNNQLHFSSLSKFRDYTEGKKFAEFKMGNENTEEKKSVSALIRRKIMYASCWYSGGETLHMWDIYGKNDKQFAIQVDLNQLLILGFHSGNFQFKSASCEAFNQISKNNKEFRPSSLHHGFVNYVDLKSNIDYKQQFIGRFKDQAFSHENEWRILLRQHYIEDTLIELDDLKCHFFGHDFSQLKKTIIVSPYANTMQFEELKNQFRSHKNTAIIQSTFTDLFV